MYSVMVYMLLLYALVNCACSNGWTDRDVVWGQTCVGPRNLVLHGVQILRREGALVRRHVREFRIVCLPPLANVLAAAIEYTVAIRPFAKLPWTLVACHSVCRCTQIGK